jgi:hypothetical protein
MKTISVGVSDDDYAAFKRAARRMRRSIAQLIREAMSMYRDEHLEPKPPLREIRVFEGRRLVGRLPSRADIYEEMHGLGDGG